eukprot:scaffold76527_cov60-Phaeocystis_antarctica.AAC.1
MEEAAPSPLPPTPWEVEEGPTEDRDRVIDGARRGAASLGANLTVGPPVCSGVRRIYNLEPLPAGPAHPQRPN